MNKLKDKLSASVRQAQAAQTPSGKTASVKKPVAPAAKPAAATAKPATSKPVVAQKPAAHAVKPAATQSQVSPLYPNRVWPD